MDEILKTLAEHTGISVETARTALGAIIAFLKTHLPEGLAGQLMSSLPEAKSLEAAYESNKTPEADTSGGLMGVIAGLAGKVFGSGEAAKLLAMLQQSGLDLKQIQAFIPKVLELIKAHLPAELYDKIVASVPGLASAAATAEKA